MVGHMIGMELVEFPSATNGWGVLGMVITCVGRTMDKELLCSRRLLLGVGMATGRGGDGFHYPIPIPVKKVHPHPYTQTQRISNFYPIPIPTG